MAKQEYQPTEEDIQVARDFLKAVEGKDIPLDLLLTHFAYKGCVGAFEMSFETIKQYEKSNEYEAGIPISDLFENGIIRYLAKPI